MILFICIAVGLLAVVGIGTAFWSIHRTHNAIKDRNRHFEDRGAGLFMTFDIWTSH